MFYIARDKPGNRDLHMDEYCLGVLLFLYNPLVTSLRAIQQASGFANVQKQTGYQASFAWVAFGIGPSLASISED
jgi:hypothetical protein